MSNDKFKLVNEYKLQEYPCGLRAGDKLKLKQNLEITDYEGNLTGECYQASEVWTVLSGVETEPNIIWLCQPDGERHTWDETIFL